jgi:hypothetical protein
MGNGSSGSTFGLIVFLCAPIVGLPALLALLTALAPGYAERARGVMRRWPGRSFLLGLVNFAFFFALAILVNVKFAPLRLIGALSLFVALPTLLTAGLLAAAGVVGERI